VSKNLILLLSAMAVATLCPAQSLWVGAVTGTNQFNFSPNYVGGEFTNLGSANQLAFYDHSGGDSFSTLDLILGFVNPPVAPPTITGVRAYTNVGNVDGGNNISAGPGTPYAVNIGPTGPTQLNSGKANAVLTGMPGLSPSESTSNYDVAEAQDGITQTGGYALYVYNLSAYAGNFGDYGLLDITFGPGIPKGTVIFGWGCGGSGCSSDYTSVATQSAFASQGPPTTVPEPGSITLLGIGSAAVMLGLWKRKRQANFTA
jgi:hypothetical protein